MNLLTRNRGFLPILAWLSFAPSFAQGIECHECNINPSNIHLWLQIEADGQNIGEVPNISDGTELVVFLQSGIIEDPTNICLDDIFGLDMSQLGAVALQQIYLLIGESCISIEFITQCFDQVIAGNCPEPPPDCEECNITEDNIEFWRQVDANGSGGLTTIDIVLMTKYLSEQDQCLVDPYNFCQDDHAALAPPAEEPWYGWEMFFDLTGLDCVSVDFMQTCLRYVILGQCP